MDSNSSFSTSVARVNLDQIEAINQKRVLAFINHWMYYTVKFLNTFSEVCNEKLQHIETSIQRTSDALALLEAKLSGTEEERKPT